MKLSFALRIFYTIIVMLISIAALAAYRPQIVPIVRDEFVDSEAQETLPENEEPSTPKFQTVETRVVWGSNLLYTLQDSGFTFNESMEVVTSLENVVNMRKIQSGQKVSIDFTQTGRPLRVSLPLNYDRTVVAKLEGNVWNSSNEIHQILSEPVRKTAVIEFSLYTTAIDSGIPIPVMMDAIELFSFEFDLQREIQRGDRIELLYLLMKDQSGETLASGNLLFARLLADGRSVEAWRHEQEEKVEYYDSKGESIRKALLRTPVDTTRISSGFGLRNHPIYGYTALHRGIDFVVASGTPIKAAGDGVVLIAGWHQDYGNYVKIRHANLYATLYAHLSTIKSGIVPGADVPQGSTIGWSGNTGLSTGPHLHYEVHYYGKPVDPSKLKFPPGHALEGEGLKLFNKKIEALNAKFSL